MTEWDSRIKMQLSGRKLRFLIWGGVALVALMVLAAGVSTINLRGGMTLSVPLRQVAPEIPVVSAPGFTNFLQKLALLLAILVPVSLIYLILSPEARKRFFIQMIQVGMIILALILLARSEVFKPGKGFNLPQFNLPQEGTSETPSNWIEPFVPNAPSWLVYLLSFGLAAVLILVGVIVMRLWQNWSRNRLLRQEPLEALATTARQALKNIRAGGDLQSIIMHCYQEMLRIAASKKGARRKEFITPREFIRNLEQAGLPAEEVRRLTRLFELVRYGDKKPTQKDEVEAIFCLEGVIAAVGAVEE